MKFVVEKEIFEKLPTACFGVVVAKGIDNGKSYPTVDALLDESIAAAAAHFEGKKVKEEPEILPYREAFRALGINPNKFMCSIEALFTRIAKGKGMPHINPIVDLGNAVSLKYTLPMGAHDLSATTSACALRVRATRSCPSAARTRSPRMQARSFTPSAVRCVPAAGRGARASTARSRQIRPTFSSPSTASPTSTRSRCSPRARSCCSM